MQIVGPGPFRFGPGPFRSFGPGPFRSFGPGPFRSFAPLKVKVLIEFFERKVILKNLQHPSTSVYPNTQEPIDLYQVKEYAASERIEPLHGRACLENKATSNYARH